MTYTLAKERLYQEYGPPCINADICEQTLLQAPQVKPNNPAALKSYSEFLNLLSVTPRDCWRFGSVTPFQPQDAFFFFLLLLIS